MSFSHMTTSYWSTNFKPMRGWSDKIILLDHRMSQWPIVIKPQCWTLIVQFYLSYY